MNKFLVILVVCLVGRVLSLESSRQLADFEGLDEYLLNKLEDDEDSESNLGRLREEVNQLEGGVRRAAEIFLELADAQQCDEHVLDVLQEGAASGIRRARNERAWTVILPHLARFRKSCPSYIDQTVEQRFASADESLKQLANIVRPGNSADVHDHPENYYFLMNDQMGASKAGDEYESINEAKLAHFVVKLNELASKPEADTNWAIQRSLVEPCKQFESNFGSLFQGAKLMSLLSGNIVSYAKARSAQFRCLAYTHKVCEAVQAHNYFN